ncbi:hypothetical protein C2E23DRAFT_864383 [Lenzites betulinus]|nr:hypothetical protein C2E23DRAFT_864383 [Lenzites betulinus]
MAGAGVWYGTDDPRNVAAPVPGAAPTNQTAELYAVELNIISDSRYVVDGMTRHLRAWEDRGWAGVANPTLVRTVVARLRARSAPTTFKWVKGHTGVLGNEGADDLARCGTEAPRPPAPALPPAPEGFVAQGARLSVLTQRLAYRLIRAQGAPDVRRRTDRVTGQVVAALHDWDCHITVSQLWKSLRRPEFRRGMRDFWWKALHGTHRVGDYWSNIPGYEQRATSYFECTAPGQQEVWAAVRATLERGGVLLPHLTVGMVLGAPAFQLSTDDPATPVAGQRLVRILVTESTYLIWCLRNRRVIGGPNGTTCALPPAAIIDLWTAVVNKRFLMDRLLTAKRLGKSALSRQTVLATWGPVLVERDALPDDWIGCTGVLVGRPSSGVMGVG